MADKSVALMLRYRSVALWSGSRLLSGRSQVRALPESPIKEHELVKPCVPLSRQLAFAAADSTRSPPGASMDGRGFDLMRKGAIHAPSRSSAVYHFRDADSRNGGGGQRRQAGHRRSSWQGASAQLRGVEAQPGRIVDQYWSASGWGRHIDQRHLARREGNQSLGGEVSSRVNASRRPGAKR